MRMSKYAVSAFLAFFVSAPSPAQDQYGQDANPYLDPAMHDYMETAYGYRNPAIAALFTADFRDSLTSLSAPGRKGAALNGPGTTALVSASGPAAAPGAPAAPPAARAPGQYYRVTFANESGPLSAFVAPLDPGALSGFRGGDYVFISVLPATADYARLLAGLSGTGFKFSGEKTYFSGSSKKTYLLGWAPYAALTAICGHPGVQKVAVEKKAAGIPLKTAIRFTLRAPSGEGADAFVADFLKRLNARTGFISGTVLRLPRASAHAKFTAFDVKGSLPVDMVGELSRSPFVAAVEFSDNSL